MKKEYSVPEIIKQDFVVSTSCCDKSTVVVPPKQNEEKEDMNGWTPWQ